MDLKLLSIENRNNFIEENKGFIYSVTQNICKRKLDWNNDDELSISLIAFNKACDNFQNSKGNFYSYASVVIKNALLDYFRKSKEPFILMFQNDNKNFDPIDYKISLNKFENSLKAKNIAEEIRLLSKELNKYKLNFDILIKSSPSHIDTRSSLLNLAFLCIKEETIMTYIRKKKLLPIKKILLLTNKSRKFLEKWRRYILTLILILSNDDYEHIKSYLNIKVDDNID